MNTEQNSADKTTNPPQCEFWSIGDMEVNNKDYRFGIFVAFKNVDDYRAALRYLDPIFSSGDRT